LIRTTRLHNLAGSTLTPARVCFVAVSLCNPLLYSRAEDEEAVPHYGWEEELDWEIRMNRGPRYLWGDLKAAEMILDEAGVSEAAQGRYAAAYELLVEDPSAGFAVLSRDAELLRRYEDADELLLGGPMLGAVHPHGAHLWVRTLKPAAVTVQVHSDEAQQTFGPVHTSFASDLAAVVRIDGLEPNTRYDYRVLVDGRLAPQPTNAQLVTAPPDGANGTRRLAFGGDFHRRGMAHRPLIEQILERDPLAMLLVGDLVVSDRFTHLGLHRADYLLRDTLPPWRQLVAQVPVYATWDDHDYLDNDLGGRERGVSRQQQIGIWEVFRRSWNNPAYGFADDRRGVFLHTRIGPVDVIMVDNKFFRDRGYGDGPSTLLGTDQMQWLEEQLLTCKAPFIILSCGTMWTDHVSSGKDSWGRFAPADRERIFTLIEEERIGPVLLISGDRHGACGYRIPLSPDFALYEFNAGCLGGIRGPAAGAPEADGDLLYRYGDGYAFGEFEFDTTPTDPTVTFRLIDDEGRIVHRLRMTRSRLLRGEHSK
jgi:alkaline phosphatase D